MQSEHEEAGRVTTDQVVDLIAPHLLDLACIEKERTVLRGLVMKFELGEVGQDPGEGQLDHVERVTAPDQALGIDRMRTWRPERAIPTEQTRIVPEAFFCHDLEAGPVAEVGARQSGSDWSPSGDPLENLIRACQRMPHLVDREGADILMTQRVVGDLMVCGSDLGNRVGVLKSRWARDVPRSCDRIPLEDLEELRRGVCGELSAGQGPQTCLPSRDPGADRVIVD